MGMLVAASTPAGTSRVPVDFSAGAAEADARPFVPDGIAAAQPLAQNQHEERVAHRVEGAAEVGADDVAVPEAEAHPGLEGAVAARRRTDADAGAEERRIEIEQTDQQPAAGGARAGRGRAFLSHGAGLRAATGSR